MRAFLKAIRDIGLLVLRLVTGAILITHGVQRWLVIGPSDGTASLEAAGVSAAALIVWLTIVFEIVGGVLLVFGLATPVAGFGLLVLSIGTIINLSGTQGFVDGWEHHALRGAVGLVLLTQGSGRLGVDALFRRDKDDANSRLIGDDEDVLA